MERTFWFIDGLSPIIKRLSISSKKYFSFSWNRALKQGKFITRTGEIYNSNQGKSITCAYRKSTFSGVFTHFDSFLPNTYKIGMICTLVNRCFWICSSWLRYHQQLIHLRVIFQKNGYPENFIGRYFKLFLNRIHILKEQVPKFEKKLLRLVLPYLGITSLKN